MLLMSGEEARRRGLRPLGRYRGMAVAGCAPDEDGHRPGVCRAEAAGAPRHDHRRRGVCGS
ncbi:hypothetical protein ACTMU2_05585 [Cupriavidus basilensis]